MRDDGCRPRVLVITRNLPPLVGGMEKLNHRMISGLCEWADVAVVGPRGCRAALPADIPVREIGVRPLWGFLLGAAAATAGFGRRFCPDLVLAGSGLTAPLARLVATTCRARSAVYVHGLDLVARQRLYRAVWLPAIRACDLVLANSRNTRRLAIERGVDPRRTAVLHPGTDLPPADAAARARFRARYGLGDRPLLLSVGRLTARKGLPAFVQHCLPAILTARPDTLLVVVGGDAVDALHRSGAHGRSALLAAAAQAGVTGAVRLLGPCDDATLGDAYRGADAHVFPLREVPGDVEGFGMVVIEAAAHGLPTVAFDVGGVADAVMEGCTGTLVAAGDYPGFADATLRRLAPADRPAARGRCTDAASRFCWSRFHHGLRTLAQPEREPAPS